MLATNELPGYLVAHGLLSKAEIVTGGLELRELNQRHHNVVARCGSGPAYFVKQAADGERRATLLREADIYAQLGRLSPGLAEQLPRVRVVDQRRGVIITDWRADVSTPRQLVTRLGQLPPAVAARIGTALARLHRAPWPCDADTAAPCPWAFELDACTVERFHAVSYANQQFLRLTQDAELAACLSAARQDWRPTALTHHDLRWDNILCAERSDGGAVLFIDFEFAGAGDPCWDVGTFCSDCLSCWLHSLPLTGNARDIDASRARYPLEQLQLAMQALWAAWLSAMEHDADAARACRLRATRHAAVRLLQTTFERAQTLDRLPHALALHVQVSLNMLQDPDAAATHLLGLEAA
jgi:aminoglycoside phosphotransferase (APT) family kinase protein